MVEYLCYSILNRYYGNNTASAVYGGAVWWTLVKMHWHSLDGTCILDIIHISILCRHDWLLLTTDTFITAPWQGGAEYYVQFVCLCVCLSASISLEPLDRSSQKFVCRSPVVVARFSSGGVAIPCVLPVLWMTLSLAVMGGMALRGRSDLLLAISYMHDQGRVWCLWMECLVSLAFASWCYVLHIVHISAWWRYAVCQLLLPTDAFIVGQDLQCQCAVYMSVIVSRSSRFAGCR